MTRYAVPVGRALFAAIFLFAGFAHLKGEGVEHAAAAGVPLASLAVPASGLLALAGGLSILLGYRARLGGIAVFLFLVPVTLALHKFWTIDDPMMRMMDRASFMKNVALAGGALLLAHFGSGPVSLDERAGRT